MEPVQASILTDNWIHYLSQKNDDTIPKFVLSSVFDMKVFISRHRNDKDTVFFAWTPPTSHGNVVYLIGGKMIQQELQIHRFSQSPFIDNMLEINTLEIVEDVNLYLNPNETINFTELHRYDKRYILSWNLRKDSK